MEARPGASGGPEGPEGGEGDALATVVSGERAARLGRPVTRSSSPPDPLLGKTLGGCRLDKLLGKGGMATVYQGEQVDLGRPVAVKVLSPELTRDAEFVQGFLREAKTLARLDHPNVVAVHQVGQEEGRYFLVMQLVTGGTLFDVLERRGRLPAGEATSLIRQVALGLRETHRKGIIHRDIKPMNVLLSEDGTPKITDFGIARTGVSGETLGVGLILGTAHYMPPEQVDAREVDARSDVYALGATFYHALTGATPYSGASMMELMLKHVSEPLVPPHERAEGIPPGISRLVCRMMAKLPEERFQDMDQLLTAMEHPEAAVTPGAAPAPAPAAPPARLLLEDSSPELPTVVVPSSAPGTGHTPRPAPPEAPAAPGPKPRAGLAVGAGLVGALGLAALLFASPSPGALTLDQGEALRLQQAWRALESDLEPLAEPQRLERLDAFAGAHPGTPEGTRAVQEAARLREAAEGRRRDALALAKELQQRGEVGLALDTLADFAGDPEAVALQAGLVAELDRAAMAWVPAGAYLSGDGPGLVRRELPGFYIDRDEVTRAGFAAWARAAGAPVPWRDEALAGEAGRLPATGLSLADATGFAAAQGKRLADAWEWERAARGEDGRAWPWGAEDDARACNQGGGELRPVGSFPRDVSPYGCRDMAGNAAEITLGPGSRAERPEVWLRGGAYRTRLLRNARPAFWVACEPGAEQHEAVGFRCAADHLPGGGAR